MAIAYAQYLGNGSTKNFNVNFPYISRDHVQVKVNGVPTSYTWLSSTTLQLPTAPAVGAIVDIRRVTPRDTLLVDFVDGSTLVETDLDLSALQVFYLAQEAFDLGEASLGVTEDGSFSALNRRISNVLDPVAPQDVATKKFVETGVTSQVVAATQKANEAAASANASASSATASANSAATSLSHAQTAETQKNLATTQASNAASSATTANSHKNAAASSATAAATSATAAANSALEAKGYRDTAAGHAAAAAQSAADAAMFDPSSYYTKSETYQKSEVYSKSEAYSKSEINSQMSAKAPLASPAFTGTPTAPTQSAGNNSTRLATTAFVTTAIGNAAGNYAPSSHTHTVSQITDLSTQLNAKAPLASPAFTGSPTAPTQSAGNNSTRLATTAFVQTAVSAGSFGNWAQQTRTNGTRYQNTSGKWMAISAKNGDNGSFIYVGSSSSMTTSSGYIAYNGENRGDACFMLVPPNWYYIVQGAHTVFETS